MFKAAFWSSFDKIFFQIFNLALSILIARFLGPEQLGVVAIVSGFVYFLNIFVDSGLTISIIRDRQISQVEVSSIFYFNLFISLTFVAITFATSRFIENYFEIADLSFYLDISSVILFLNSLAFVRYAKLEQEMEFKLLSYVNLSSILIAGSICLIMLYLDYGIFSVVLFSINAALIKNACYLIFTPSFKLLRFDLKSLIPHLRFGKNLLFSSSVEALYSNGIPILITKLFTTYYAGIFFQSKKLGDGPTSLFSTASRRIFLPMAAKVNNDIKGVQTLLLTILKPVNFFFILSLGLLFINSDILILELMGSEWKDSILILKILILGMIFYPSFFLCLDVFKTQGDSGMYSKIIISSRVISIIIILGTSYFGFLSLVICFSISQLLMFAIVLFQLNRNYSYSIRHLLKTMVPFLTVFIPLILLSDLLTFKDLNSYLLHFIKSTIFILSFITAIALFFKFNPLNEYYRKFISYPNL